MAQKPPATPTENPFAELCAYRDKLVPIAIQLSQQRPSPLNPDEVVTSSIENTRPIMLLIRSLTSDELQQADSVLNAAKPPQLFDEMPSPRGVGTMKTPAGFDFDDPGYLSERAKLNLKRSAYVALFGCPQLMETTDGSSVEAKAETLMKRIPSVAVELICSNIELLGVSGVVGAAEVERFFTNGSESTDGTSSGGSSTRSRRKKRSDS